MAFPDIELLLVRWLASQLEDDAYVCQSAPADMSESLPLVRVARRGGPALIRQQIDQPRTDIDVWHVDQTSLSALVERVRDLIDSLRGVTTDVGTVTDVVETVGPQRLPEDDPQMVRAGFSVAILTRRLLETT